MSNALETVSELKVLDDLAKKRLINKLVGMSSETNKGLYEFALTMSDELSEIDWHKSGGKMNFLEDLIKQPNVHIKDSGCLRQIIVAGNFIGDYYRDNIDYLNNIGYWNFHNIARAKLSENEQRSVEKKQTLINRIVKGDLKEGNLKAAIQKIKDTDMPKELNEHLEWYNMWSISRLDRRFGIEHPGQIPGQILINLIYHYLDENAVMVDPMAGGGTTHDVCEYFNSIINEESAQLEIFDLEIEYNLTCHSFDLVPRRDFVIQKNALKDDWGVENVDCVFLDPPYYSMKKDDYVENDFTASRKSFYGAIDMVAAKSHSVLKDGGICALIIQPQTEKDLEPGEVCIDLPFECYKIMEKYFKPYQRVQVPLSTQQFSPTSVNRVKKYSNRNRLLGTARDLIIMKK